jgi:hypothetical protein
MKEDMSLFQAMGGRLRLRLNGTTITAQGVVTLGDGALMLTLISLNSLDPKGSVYGGASTTAVVRPSHIAN